MNRLGAIDGIGKAKLENYGQDLLARPRTEGESPGKASADSPGRLAADQRLTPPSPEGVRNC